MVLSVFLCTCAVYAIFLEKDIFQARGSLFRHLRGYTECWGVMFTLGSPSAPWLYWKLLKLSFVRGDFILVARTSPPYRRSPGAEASVPGSPTACTGGSHGSSRLPSSRDLQGKTGCSFNVTPPPFLPPFRQLAFFEISLAKPANVNRSVLGFVCFN